jgi:hypothetical protein
MARDTAALLALKPGWDSYEAEPITEAAARTADAVAFVPRSDGGIQIELHGGGVDLEIEIAPDGSVRDLCWERR